MEFNNTEFTACHYSSSKYSHCIFGTSTGKLYNIKLNLAFSRLEPAFRREICFLQTEERSFPCRINKIVAIENEIGAYAVASD
jgi:hypothetical protein